MTTIKMNRDEICRLCGNRGGIDGSVAYAGAEAIAKILGGRLKVFRVDDEFLSVAEWEYASGTYRAERTSERHQVRVIDVAGECMAVDGDFAEPCLAAMKRCLADNMDRIARRGNLASSDPLDMGFDPKLHRTM